MSSRVIQQDFVPLRADLRGSPRMYGQDRMIFHHIQGLIQQVSLYYGLIALFYYWRIFGRDDITLDFRLFRSF